MPPLPDRLLACPVCAEPLTRSERTLACGRGHRFDAARQGYFNLLTGKGSVFEGDSPAMVDAREDFLGSGHYDPLRRAVVAAALSSVDEPAEEPGVVLDAGAGTGYYLRGVADAAPHLYPIALDVSKIAVRRAARALPEGIGLVWDIWRPLPLLDRTVKIVLNVFAPRNPEEFARVLAPGGRLVVVTPRPGHLAGLDAVGPLLAVPDQKADDVRTAFDGALVETSRIDLDHVMDLPPELARAALGMGPAARHGDGGPPTEDAPGVSPVLTVQARFTVQVLVKPSSS